MRLEPEGLTAPDGGHSATVRIVVAPDKFAGTLSAVQAAEAIATGWHRHAPRDETLAMPMADGGPGFVDVVHAALGGDLLALTVCGPQGEEIPATVLVVADEDRGRAGGTAYVESAQACGLALLPRAGSTVAPGVAETTTTYGVGQLVAAAVDAGVGRVVVGLGGSGSNDGGAGLLAALGATSQPPGVLTGGGAGLLALRSVDVAPARARLAGVEVVIASDVDNPLLGLRGATNVYGRQKGIAAERLVEIDGGLTRLAHAASREPADAKGAGAAGGLGYALLLLGGRRVPGLDTVADTVGLRDALRGCDLVVTGEGSFDWQSLSGKVVSGVAALAQRSARPCVVLAGEVSVGARETRTMGADAAYSVVDLVGREQARGRPADALADLAERVARTWGRR